MQNREMTAKYGEGWDKISWGIRQRDKHRCRVCGGSNKLCVHHITPIEYFNRDFVKAHNPDNLVTLCLSCHMKTHAGSIKELLIIPEE